MSKINLSALGSTFTYLDFLIYDWFQSGKFYDTVCNGTMTYKEGLTEHFYKNVFWSPEPLIEQRSALLHGLPHPLVALWRTKPWDVADKMYGYSSLTYDLTWHDDPTIIGTRGTEHNGRARVVTFSTQFSLIGESYLLSFVNRFAADLLELNFVRYPEIYAKGYMDDYVTHPEFKVSESSFESTNADENSKVRYFRNHAKIDVTIMLPQIREAGFIEKLNMWLGERKILTIAAPGIPIEPDDAPPHKPKE